MTKPKRVDWRVISSPGPNWPYLLREPGEAMGIYTAADHLNDVERLLEDAEAALEAATTRADRNQNAALELGRQLQDARDELAHHHT